MESKYAWKTVRSGGCRKYCQIESMKPYSKPITEIIRSRFSCREYAPLSIEEEELYELQNYIRSLDAGPFGTPARFKIVRTKDDDRSPRKLGTYGFIKDAPSFILGAVPSSEKCLEDFGFLMEEIILYATDIGLGTCWLGGTFNKSSFAKRISITEGEHMPAVAALGHIKDMGAARNSNMRRRNKSATRLKWEELFSDRKFGHPLSSDNAGGYSDPLEMLRLAPSASNKQPWRVVKDGNLFHLYLKRTKGYRESLAFKILRIADMQRIDMGIAICHFELTAAELGLKGKWIIKDPGLEIPDTATEYIASWIF